MKRQPSSATGAVERKRRDVYILFAVGDVFFNAWRYLHRTPTIADMPSPSPNALHPTLVALGAAIRVARLERGISQEDLADRAGISRAHMSKIERGRTNPQLLSVLRVATVMKITVSELLTTVRL